MDLPVVPRRHVQAKLARSLHHVALEGDIVKAFVRVFHHRRHVDVRRRVHGVMPNHGQVINVRFVAALDDLFDRRLAARNRYRCKHACLLVAHIRGSAASSPSFGFMPRDSAQRCRVAKTLLSSGNAEGLPLRSSGFSKNRTGKFFLIFEVLKQSGHFKLFR